MSTGRKRSPDQVGIISTIIGYEIIAEMGKRARTRTGPKSIPFSVHDVWIFFGHPWRAKRSLPCWMVVPAFCTADFPASGAFHPTHQLVCSVSSFSPVLLLGSKVGASSS